jgi:F-type H+-transporting ATPase subunit a
VTAALLAAAFEPPSTHDFVYGCWGPSLRIAGVGICLNFITFLVVLTAAVFFVLFWTAFRRPALVPSKFQTLMEAGIEFVRENIAIPMLGEHADQFMPLLTSLFFFILIANFFEVIPGFNLAPTSRVAIPLVLAVVSWVTYNAVGIRRHGFLGYLRLTCIIAAAPWWLRYTLLMVIEFVSNIVVRPITLTVRLTANFLAGHFLLAIFFLGTIFFLSNGPKTWLFALFSFPLSVVLVGFEIFVAVLQAFIFAILTASYIGGALAAEH